MPANYLVIITERSVKYILIMGTFKLVSYEKGSFKINVNYGDSQN